MLTPVICIPRAKTLEIVKKKQNTLPYRMNARFHSSSDTSRNEKTDNLRSQNDGVIENVAQVAINKGVKSDVYCHLEMGETTRIVSFFKT